LINHLWIARTTSQSSRLDKEEIFIAQGHIKWI